MARCSNIQKLLGTNGQAYENLAAAVVYVACEDWRLETKWLNDNRHYLESNSPYKHEKYEQHQHEKDMIENFFLSEWFAVFTSLDPRWLLDNLEREDELPQAREIIHNRSLPRKKGILI